METGVVVGELHVEFLCAVELEKAISRIGSCWGRMYFSRIARTGAE